jgi:hypothetical protein
MNYLLETGAQCHKIGYSGSETKCFLSGSSADNHAQRPSHCCSLHYWCRHVPGLIMNNNTALFFMRALFCAHRRAPKPKCNCFMNSSAESRGISPALPWPLTIHSKGAFSPRKSSPPLFCGTIDARTRKPGWSPLDSTQVRHASMS